VQSPKFSPLYQQVKDALLVRLGAGDWQPGTLLPSEMELASQLGVSQGTVRKAIDSLAAEHLLTRRQGRGTYVATHQETVAQFRFLRLRPDKGEAVQPESLVLSVQRQRAPADVGQFLKLRPAELAFKILRRLSFGGAPVVLDEIWLSAQRFKGLSLEKINQYNGPLYGLFETEYQTRMIRCVERLRAMAARIEESHVLGVAVGEPVLVVERVSYGYDDEAVEVRKGYCLTKHFHYLNELT
jgi:GntR family transcriptional regulator